MTWGDPTEAAARERTFRSGTWPTALALAVYVLYILLTWDGPHRTALLALGVLGGLGAFAVFAAPVGRVIRSRWCDPFLVAFSGSLIVLATIAAGLDGGTRSPYAALLFLPLAFAALSYPLRPVIGVATVDILSFTGLAVLTPHGAAANDFVFAGTLATTALMCAWQARNHAEQRRELARASRTDSLTGCLNRRGFEERLQCALAAARRNEAGLGVVIIDLDDFKLVNDAGGHAAGDEVLRWVADTLRQTVRGGDEVGRLGGDEFAVLLGSGHENTDVATRRIATALAERAPASVGAATYPDDGVTADELYRAADDALYARKRGDVSVVASAPRAA